MRLNEYKQAREGIIATALPVVLIIVAVITSALILACQFSNAVNWIIEGLKR